jgi:hypothetical protein
LSGGLKVDTISSLTDLITFASDTQFFGRPYFTTDTAGFITIHAGETRADVIYDREYLEQPIVTASINFEQSASITASSTPDDIANDEAAQNALIAQIFNADIRNVVAYKSTRGFSILIDKPAPVDLTFSWVTLAVKNAKTFTSRPSPLIGSPQPPVPTPTSIEEPQVMPTPTSTDSGSPPPEPLPVELSPAPSDQTSSPPPEESASDQSAPDLPTETTP